MTPTSFSKMNSSVGSFPPRHHNQKFRNLTSCFRRRSYRPPGTLLLNWKFDGRQRAYGRGVEVSARKLAAGLWWQLRLLAKPEASDGGVKCGSCDQFRFQHEFSLPHPNLLMEGVTNWDPGCSKTSTKAYCLYNHGIFLEDQVTTSSVVSYLQAELAQAQLRIRELEDENWSSVMIFEKLMKKLGEKRNSWYFRKHNAMRAIIDGLKDELSEERKNRKQIEFLHSKFVKELAKTESSAKQFMQDYKEEKKAREQLQETCNDLAKRIGEDRSKQEMLKSGTMIIHEEMEEEKNMLQLAEGWREEHVQMKLVDAKFALEHKYSEMNKLVEELESFLRSSAATLDEMTLRKADFIGQEIKSVNIQKCQEFEYVPPESESIFSMFEELRTADNEMVIEREPITNNNPICDASNYHIAYVHAWESSKHVEDQGSRCSIEGSGQSLNSVSRGKVASKSIAFYKGNSGQHSPNTEISDGCSITEEQPNQKGSYPSQLRLDEGVGRFQNVTNSSGSGIQRDSTRQIVSANLENPHITRGMKGSSEWPRVTQKTNLKGKLFKAMMKNQKIHLHKV